MKRTCYMLLMVLALFITSSYIKSPIEAATVPSSEKFSSSVAQMSYETTGDMNKDLSATSYIASINESSDKALSTSYGCSTGCSTGCSSGCLA